MPTHYLILLYIQVGFTPTAQPMPSLSRTNSADSIATKGFEVKTMVRVAWMRGWSEGSNSRVRFV